jgi:predicted nucleic acid-binding protein
VTAEVFDDAGRLEPEGFRSLDALHLAAAMQLGGDLEGVVAYDERLAAAAREIGITVVSPGR